MTTTAVPTWSLKGDWFDVCTCNVPCPCTFAQAPTDNKCTAMFAYRITEGTFGDTDLSGLNVGALVRFEGNVWAGETKAVVGLMVDDRANDAQMAGLSTIFGGAGGGWPAAFASLIGDFRGVEVVPIRIEIADDLSAWSIKVSGKYAAASTALTGPTADPSRRVQLINTPGSEVGPGAHSTSTWGVGDVRQIEADLFGDFDVAMTKRSSKHIPFSWSGPDA